MAQIDPSFFSVLASRIVPEFSELDQKSREEFFSIIEKALSARPPAMIRQLNLFLGVMRWMPVMCTLRTLDRLPGETQDKYLRWFQSGPVGLFRKGFWGVKTLVFMGYYGRPEAGAAIGYRPSFNGNERLIPSPYPLPSGEDARRAGEGVR